MLLFSCHSQPSSNQEILVAKTEEISTEHVEFNIPFDSTFKTIHIYVALCDNKYQGIVPVPAKIGDGQNPNSNLYWGCGYGIRTYFKQSTEWKLVSTEKLDSTILERLIFKHTSKNFYLIADAYNGKLIKRCTEDFLRSSCGKQKQVLETDGKKIGVAGNASLIAYIGHDGLMDFQLEESFVNNDNVERSTIILACYSKNYFSQHLKQANINPLVWTTGLMCPEAYTVHDAISGYVSNESNEKIRSRAAMAYSKYQKCSEKAARNLLVSGW